MALRLTFTPKTEPKKAPERKTMFLLHASCMGFHVCIGDGSVAGASLVLGCIKPVVESPGF